MITYPLNNIDYTAEDAELFHCTRTSGVFDGDAFPVSVTGLDNNITVGPGIAWIQNTPFSGKAVALKESIVVTPELADAVYPRIDAVVIRFDVNANGSEIAMKTGTPSSAPVAPEVVQTETVFELHLRHVYRGAGALTVTEEDITDLRHDPAYCGIMLDPISSVDSSLTKAGFAADAKAVGDALDALREDLSASGNMRKTLIWENASPDSSFAGQTITFLSGQLVEGDKIELWCRNKCTDSAREMDFSVYVGNGRYMYLPSMGSDTTSAVAVLRQRTVAVTTDTITLGDCEKCTSGKAGWTADNLYISPVRIYRIRTV